MDGEFGLKPAEIQKIITAQDLRECNKLTARFGLLLNETQIQELVTARFEALQYTGRIEFGEGILRKLILAFCDSSYIMQEDYCDTILKLQEAFYYFKNESGNHFSDDELIEFMKTVFDGRAQGSVDFLAGTSLEELCRFVRSGWSPNDAGSQGMLF